MLDLIMEFNHLNERLMDRIHGKVYGGVILLRLHELFRVTYLVT